jgi:ABC-type methionine transport system permease subunit
MSAELVFVVGFVASIVVWLLKKAFIDKGQKIPLWVYNIALGIVSLVLALPFAPVALPPFPGTDGTLLGFLAALVGFVAALVPILLAEIAFARIIYEALLQKVLEGLGNRIRKVLGSDIG